MSTPQSDPALTGQTYSTLRFGGAPCARARTELGLSPATGRVLEAQFQAHRPGRAVELMRPRFARCRAHVAAVQAQGGYPVLSR